MDGLDLFAEPAPPQLSPIEIEAGQLRATVHTCRQAAEVFRSMKLPEFAHAAEARAKAAGEQLVKIYDMEGCSDV